MTIDATRLFEAITDYVEATVDYELESRDVGLDGQRILAHNERIRRDHARQTLRETLREEFDP